MLQLLQQHQNGKSCQELKSLWASLLTIELVGPGSQLEKLAYKAKKDCCLHIRPHVVYQWLSVLQQVHQSYKDDPQLLNQVGFFDFKHLVDEFN